MSDLLQTTAAALRNPLEEVAAIADSPQHDHGTTAPAVAEAQPKPRRRPKSPFRDATHQLEFLTKEVEMMVSACLRVIDRRRGIHEIRRELLMLKSALEYLREIEPPPGDATREAVYE